MRLLLILILFVVSALRAQESNDLYFGFTGVYSLENESDHQKYGFNSVQIEESVFHLFDNNVLIESYKIETKKDGFFILRRIDSNSSSKESKKLYLKVSEIELNRLKVEFGVPSSLSTLIILKNT